MSNNEKIIPAQQQLYAALCRKEPTIGTHLPNDYEVSGPGYSRVAVTMEETGKGVDFPAGAQHWGFKGWLALLDESEVVLKVMPLGNQVKAVFNKGNKQVEVLFTREGNDVSLMFIEPVTLLPYEKIPLPIKVLAVLGLEVPK